MLFQACQSSLPMWAWLFLLALFWLPEIQGNCTSPVPPPHSTQKEDPPNKSYPVGTNLTYHCITGYEYIPGINPSVTCLNNSKWSEISELCREVKCDRPEVENGKITNLSKPSYTYNESISFECNSGYSAVGSLHIKCGANSSWIPAIPKCVKDNCTSPVLPSHSMLKEDIPKEGYPVGTVLRIHCITGYEYIPGINPSVTCLNTSKWTEISELCQGKKCPAPIIENGKVDAEDDVRLGDSVTFSCVSGFRLIGEATRMCILKDGKVVWNSALPHCEHIPCKRPDKILNGLYDPDSKDEYYVGSVVIYRCERDFSLIGNSTITCITEEDGLNGKWNLPAPECKHVKCDRPKVENGKITSLFQPSYTYNEVISFECNSGYSAVGSLHIKCGANSSWIPAIPKCVKDNCTSPVLPPHSTLKEDIPKEGYPVGTVLRIHCILGYEYIPGINSSVTCLNTSKWTEISELCQGKTCPAPIIENGKVDAEDDVRLGDSVTFSCVSGYRLIGEATRMCILKDGKVVWNSTLPHCERKRRFCFKLIKVYASSVWSNFQKVAV
ncbi:complement component receptor 1-like protein isoform 2-T2 [Vipera latastei]